MIELRLQVWPVGRSDPEAADDNGDREQDEVEAGLHQESSAHPSAFRIRLRSLAHDRFYF